MLWGFCCVFSVCVRVRSSSCWSAHICHTVAKKWWLTKAYPLLPSMCVWLWAYVYLCNAMFACCYGFLSLNVRYHTFEVRFSSLTVGCIYRSEFLSVRFELKFLYRFLLFYLSISVCVFSAREMSAELKVCGFSFKHDVTWPSGLTSHARPLRVRV